MLNGWTYWRDITIDHTVVDAELTDFPVPITLTSENFDFSKARSDGYDIRFTRADGVTLLKYERVSHDQAGQTAEYWVKVPFINADVDTIIRVYYGKPDADDGSDKTAVWYSALRMVHHMGDATTGTISDSTQYGNNGTKKGANEPAEAAGQIGKAQSFDGANDYIRTVNADTLVPDGSSGFTVEAWVKTDVPIVLATNDIIISATSGTRFYMRMGNGPAFGWGSQYVVMTGLTYTVGVWHHQAWVYDGSNFIAYKNGSPVSTQPYTGDKDSPSATVDIGSNEASNKFKGSIEEVRIYDDIRPAAWLKADYHAGNGTLLTVGDEREIGFVPEPVCEFHVLAVIELTDLTLRYADTNMSMSDGNFYEGRLEAGNLSRAFSCWTEPKQRQSTLAITLKDHDRTVRAFLDSFAWGLRPVKVYVGKGRALEDYTLDFDGIVKFPGGISYDDRRVRIQLRDARDRDTVTLPSGKYLTVNYPNLEEESIGRVKPIVYGDWSDTAIPCVCTDTTVNEFTAADHAIKAIVQAYKNGAAVSHTNENLAAASFRISSYDPENDTVTVRLQGKPDGDGNLITHPVDILLDLQENYIGIDAADIDTEAYDDLKEEISGFAARRFIGWWTALSDTLIEEIAAECGFDIIVENGKYTVKSRIPSQAYETLYDETNVMAGSMAVEFDPEGLYSNRMMGDYDFDPVNSTYRNRYQADNTVEQAAAGQVISRTMRFCWLYQDSDVETMVERTMLLFSHEVRVVRFEGLGEAILTQLADRVGFTFANFTGRPLLVREIGKDFKSRSCEIAGYDVLSFASPGYWTGDDAPAYADATAEQRKSQGFFTDDDGCAEPGNEASKVSHWW